MAKVMEINHEAWAAEVATFPPLVQELCNQLPPDRLYRMKSSGHRVTINAYNIDGTVIVDVTGKYNFVLFERRVFGVFPADFEECELPAGERLGVQLTNPEEIQAALDKLAQGNRAPTRH